MSGDRYPRICYDQLFLLDQRACNIPKYNWVSMLRVKLVELGYAEVWTSQNPETVC